MATLLLQTKNNVSKRSRRRLDCLTIPRPPKRKEGGLGIKVLGQGGCTVLYMLHLTSPLRPGTVHDLYRPRCLVFSSLLDFLWMSPVLELQLMKTNMQWHFPSGNYITGSSAHLWYHFLVDTSVSGIHDICNKLTVHYYYYQSASFPDHLVSFPDHVVSSPDHL